MRKRIIKGKQITAFARHLLHQEKSKNTIKQYVCALVQFVSWLQTEAHGGSRWPEKMRGSRWLLDGSQPLPGNRGSRWPLSGWRLRPGGTEDKRLQPGSAGGGDRQFWPNGTGERHFGPAGVRGRAAITRDLVLAYKEHLKRQYKPSSVNAKLAALNCFFTWQCWPELKVSTLKLQQRMFLDKSQQLEKEEYTELTTEAVNQGNIRLALMMETMCCTGMRVSELQYVTVEAVRRGLCRIDCKGKIREVFLPDDLQDKLQEYIEKGGRACGSGPIFATRTGRPVNTRNVWREMKGLCEKTGIAPEKVYPHNLRHLFARTYYEQTKDIVRLADLLGHSSVQTTRIYTRTSGAAERETVNQLALSVKYNKAA